MKLPARLRAPRSSFAGLLAAAVLVLGSSSCDSAEIGGFGFDPFEVSEERYALYGYLDLDRAVQTLRVVPVRGEIERPQSPEDARIEASVLTVREGTRDTLAWNQVPTLLPDGSYATIFQRRFTPALGATYHLVIRESDDSRPTSAETTVPRPEAEVGDPVQVGEALIQTVTWSDISEVTSARMTYIYPGPAVGLFSGPTTFDYTGEVVVEDSTARVAVDLTRDRLRLQQLLLDDTAEAPPPIGAYMEVAVRGASWTPDPMTGQPSSNVEGGTGFWGAVGRNDVTWVFEGAALHEAGWPR